MYWHGANAMTRLLPIIAAGLVTGSAMGGTTITPLQGSLGDPFNNGAVHGWTWHGDQGNDGSLIGSLYDNMISLNGGAATAGACGPFAAYCSTQAFIDWTSSDAQWGDDLHGLAGPARGGPTAVITSVRYGYRNTIATATHTIQIYDMVPPSASHPTYVTGQFGAQLLSLVLPAMPTGTAFVTVTGLDVHAGVSAWIKFGETGPGFPGTFWLSGGAGNGIGTTHYGLLYDIKDFYGPGQPLHYFLNKSYFYFPKVGIVAPNIQVALSGFVLPAPAAISLLGLGGLGCLQPRRRSRRRSACT
jgi:hypothetical protein